MGMVIPAFAAVTEPVTIEISEENGAAAIVNALYLAGEQASEATPYEIYVAAGRYELDRGLHIFSNTALILDENAVIVDCAAQGDNMIKVGTTGDVVQVERDGLPVVTGGLTRVCHHEHQHVLFV